MATAVGAWSSAPERTQSCTAKLAAARRLLDRGHVIALWGARRPDQLTPVSEVTGWSLDDEAMRDIERILAEKIKDPVGPEFMAPPPKRAGEAVSSAEKR
jgi:aryl-alcohol dehydrogenase-like predicted oxidoreductase